MDIYSYLTGVLVTAQNGAKKKEVKAKRANSRLPLFHRIPKYVLWPVLQEWISVVSLCKFDTAVCNRNERDFFLQLIAGSSCTTIRSVVKSRHQLCFLTWIQSKKLKISELVVDLDFVEMRDREWSMFDDFTLRKVEIVSANSDSYTLIAKVCRDLMQLRMSHWSVDGKCAVSMMETITIQSPNLVEITFFNCGIFALLAFPAVVSSCRNLKSLSFTDTDEGYNRGSEYLSRIKDTKTTNIIIACTELTTLNLYHCAYCHYYFAGPEGKNGLLWNLLRTCRKLRHVSLLRMDFYENFLCVLCESSSDLRYLAAETLRPTLTSEVIVSIAQNCRQLECLNICNGDMFTAYASGFRADAWLPLVNCPELKYFCPNVFTPQSRADIICIYAALKDVCEDIVCEDGKRLCGEFEFDARNNHVTL